MIIVADIVRPMFSVGENDIAKLNKPPSALLSKRLGSKRTVKKKKGHSNKKQVKNTWFKIVMGRYKMFLAN